MADLIIPDTILSEELKNKISTSLGWTPKIEDTTQPLEGDNYPLIDNPITRDMFLGQAIVAEITSSIIRRGRAYLIQGHNAEIDKITNGDFDSLILT